MGKRKNPETSNAAYRSLDPANLSERYQKILLALKKIKEGTFEEVAVAAGLEPQMVWKRLSELQKSGLIYRPGNKRRLKSGREGFTWCLTGELPAELQAREQLMGGKSVSEYADEIITVVRQHTRKTKKADDIIYKNKLF